MSTDSWYGPNTEPERGEWTSGFAAVRGKRVAPRTQRIAAMLPPPTARRDPGRRIEHSPGAIDPRCRVAFYETLQAGCWIERAPSPLTPHGKPGRLC